MNEGRREWLEFEESWLTRRLNDVRHELHGMEHHHHHLLRHRLHRIAIRFHNQGEEHMAPKPGPLTLTAAGQIAVASVIGFDQNDQPRPAEFVMPPVTFKSENPEIVSSTKNDDGVTSRLVAVENGSTVISASVSTEEGEVLSASSDVTVAIEEPPPAPVLTRIEIAFDTEPAQQGATDVNSALSPNQRLNQAIAH